MAYAEHVAVPPIAVKLPGGVAYMFSDGPQHVQVLYAEKSPKDLQEPDPSVVVMLERLVTALLPKLTWRPHDQVRTWLNAISPDGLPLAGPVEGLQGLWACTGLAEQGGLLGPALAVNLAEALCGRAHSPVLNDMMPARVERMQVTQSAGSDIIKGQERLVAAPEVQSGQERLVQPEGIDIQRGEEHFVDGPQLIKGEEHLVDAPQIIRSSAQVAMEEAANIKRPEVTMEQSTTPGDNKVKMGSLKKDTPGDKKVTMGTLKKK
jgi:hypothetical protein